MSFKKASLKKIRDILLQQRKDTAKIEEKVAIDLDGDEIDEIQGKQMIELNRHLSERKAIKNLQAEEALTRLDKGTYGICQDCEEEIPEKRLLANPCVMTCVCCAEDRENENKKQRF